MNMQGAREGRTEAEKAAREKAWGHGYSDGGDGQPPSWPDAETLPDYEAGHVLGMEDRKAEQDATAWLRGCYATIERHLDRRAGEIAEKVGTDAGQAALTIVENLCVTFRALVKAVDRDEAYEGTAAVLNTLNQIDTIEAAKAAHIMPPDRDATRRGLARIINKKRAQLAKMGRDLLRVVPPAFLDEAGGDLWTAMESAESVTDPRAAAWRFVRRELDVLVQAWDAL